MELGTKQKNFIKFCVLQEISILLILYKLNIIRVWLVKNVCHTEDISLKYFLESNLYDLQHIAINIDLLSTSKECEKQFF